MGWKLTMLTVVCAIVLLFFQVKTDWSEVSSTSGSTSKLNEQVEEAQIATQVMAKELAEELVQSNADTSREGVEYQLSESTLLLFDNLIAEVEQKFPAVLTEKLQFWMEQAELNLASQVMLHDVFNRYIEYKRALGDIKSSGHEAYMSSVHMADILESVKNLRFEWFSEQEIAALFSAQQSHDESALARLRIREDNSLSAAEKNRLIAQSIAELPDTEQAAFKPSLQIRRVQQLQVETVNLSKEQRLARLSAEFGEEAGQRLNQVFTQQDAWKNRVRDFRSQLMLLQDNAQLSQHEREEQMQLLKTDLFNADELKRLDVYLRHPELLISEADK